MDLIERFLNYVSIDTCSDETSDTCPSTAHQFDLARVLVDELKAMDVTFADYGAVKAGKVYVTTGSMYQLASRSGTIAESIYEVLSGKKEETEYIYRLK